MSQHRSREHESKPFYTSTTFLTGAAAVVGSAGLLAFAASRFHFSGPTNYLVRTGFGISRIQARPSFVRWPFQKVSSISTTPFSHKWTFKCLSSQYLPFNLPMTVTYAPYGLEDMEGALAFASQMSTLTEEEMANTIHAVIHGEVRVRASTVSIDDLNDNRQKFRDEVEKKVDEVLRKFGVRILNLNVAEIEEEKRTSGMSYLESREKKKLSAALSQAEIDVAEAKKRADIETMTRRADTRKQVALLEQQAILVENEQKQRMAESTARLAVTQAEAKKQELLAQIDSQTAALLREEELQKTVEAARQERELIKLRAQQLTKTQVESEEIKNRADAQRYKINQEAEADFFAIKRKADGKLLEYQAEADGSLKIALARAEGTRKELEAEGQGMNEISKFSSDLEVMKLYLLLRSKMPEKLAEAQAQGLMNLKPTVWNFNQSGGPTNTSSLLNDFLRVFPASLQMLQNYYPSSSPPPLQPSLPKQGDMLPSQ